MRTLTERLSNTATPGRPETKTLARAAATFFRFPSPQLLSTKLAIVLTARMAVADWSVWDLAIVAAVAIYWPMQEWFLHVHVLHMKPFRAFGRTIDPIIARYHRWHHREPWNLATSFLPARLLLALIPLNILLWLVAMPTPGLGLTGVASLTAAALLYEWTHYLTHTHYRPRSGYYRRIWLGHRLHHFKNERYWHAFTVPWVDSLMGTAPDQKDVELSPTCRTLGGRDS